LTENAGRENDGRSYIMTRHENENARRWVGQ